ncbi:MAG: ferritin-like domain-containing protein [Anaerolineae bacterium]|nr:ferritin-like domain-containing protein [Gemmatimonadaceae bacterium]
MADGKNTFVIGDPAALGTVETRRQFLRMLGVGGSIVLLPTLFAACDDDDTGIVNPPPSGGVTINLSNDTGILNYAYALEQLEAAFYTAVLAAPVFATLSAPEQEIFTDLQRHEVIHREFFKNALGSNAIGTLTPTASAVTGALATRNSLLLASETFEDLGVAAYNGAGKYLTVAANLLAAGKIVSVEARHAAVIRDIRDGTNGTKFANSEVVNAQGLDVKLEFVPVLTAANPFIDTEITLTNVPAVPAGSTDQAPQHS